MTQRSVTAKTGLAHGVDGERHAGAPPETHRFHCLDLAGPLDVGQALELLAHDNAEECSLNCWIDMLEVAPTALASSCFTCCEKPGPMRRPIRRR